jgi:hypothetical protein
MSDTVIHLPTAFGNRENITFSTPFNEGNRVDVEITARQKSEPTQGATTGIYVVWDVCRGLAEVNPILTRVNHKARQQFVVIVEGRESAAGSAWYVCEASDVQANTKHLIGTGKTLREAFDDFCQRAETVLSESPADLEQAKAYGSVEQVEEMREQARRCFCKAD